MSYRRRNYGYGRGMAYSLRSEAYRMDGAANDEGWHYAFCYSCNKKTEHGSQCSGTYCVPCDDRARGIKC